MAGTRFLSHGDQANEQLVLHAMALYPDDEECVAHLKEHHDLTLTAAHLASLRATRPAELQTARDNMAIPKEQGLVSDLGDNAALAGMDQLDAGTVREPWRAGRDAADMQAKAGDPL